MIIGGSWVRVYGKTGVVGGAICGFADGKRGLGAGEEMLSVGR